MRFFFLNPLHTLVIVRLARQFGVGQNVISFEPACARAIFYFVCQAGWCAKMAVGPPAGGFLIFCLLHARAGSIVYYTIALIREKERGYH